MEVMIMRRALICLLLLLSLLMMFGCKGKNGEEGKTFLKVWLINCTRYWDNNPGIPFGFNTTTFYLCNPGTYDYEYDTSDGWEWWGTYTLVAEEGEEGGLFQNGDDGEDRRYTFTCQSSGPTLTYTVGKGKDAKLLTPVQVGEDEFEINYSDGKYRFEVKAFRRASTGGTRTKLSR